MNKFLILIVLVAILVITVSPASAMIGGELDTEHTNVGAIMMEWTRISDDPIIGRLCTATLIHPQALVTAAHCYQPFINQGTGYEKIWITFDQDPFAMDAVFLNVADFIPHPEYNDSSYRHDLALIILEDPIPEELEIYPEPLPEEGYLDGFLKGLKGKWKKETKMTIVGYGATELWPLPDLNLDAIRHVGTVSYINLLPLEILVNNSGQDDVAICYGDSGGPIFFVDQHGDEVLEVLIGVHSSSGVVLCNDALLLMRKYRLDTAPALGFINDTISEYFPPE